MPATGRPNGKTAAAGGALEEILAGQRPDGGWCPSWAHDYSSLDQTCFQLAQLEQAALAPGHPAIARAVAFLKGRQKPDGFWEEDPAVRGLAPMWAEPGNPATILYLTANCAFWTALYGGLCSSTESGAGALARELDSGEFASFPHTYWLAGALFYLVGWQDKAEICINWLEGHISTLCASNLGWCVNTLLLAGFSPQHPFLARAAARLENLQEADGRWRSEDGPASDVHATLEAMRALMCVFGLGLAPPD